MSNVIYDERDHVAILTLNRPEHLNSVNSEMINALFEASIKAAKDIEGLYVSVKFVNHRIQILGLSTQTNLVILVVVALGAKFLDRLSKLFNPSEIFELVHAALVELRKLKNMVQRNP